MKNVKYFLLAFFLINTFSLFAQIDPDKVEIKAEKISDNIYMLTGAGGNIGVCIGDDGVFMIDDQFAPLSKKIQAAIAKLSDKSVKFLINTHWHGDHTGGNENFGQTGAIIVAHENVRKRMSTEQMMQAFGRKVPAAPEGALPIVTFPESINFHMNGESILVMHLHHAHTDGDALIYFQNSNVIHMGDTYFNGNYPFIDVSSGGSIDGIIATANKVLFLANPETKIIPGHGALSNKAELTAYRNMLMEVRDNFKMAYDKGMTIEEMKSADLTKDLDEKWGNGFIKPEKLLDILYSDFSREK